jgi:acyl dehydratase
VIEQRGLWFEEFDVGARYLHRPGRTITEADNTFFTTLTMNTQPLHLDEHWSAGQEFGGRLVNSLLTLSVVVGLSVTQLTLNTVVANLGFGEISFPRPVRHGDTLYAETLVLSARRSSSRPGQGIVRLRHVGTSQRGETVVTVERSTLVQCTPEQARS